LRASRDYPPRRVRTPFVLAACLVTALACILPARAAWARGSGGVGDPMRLEVPNQAEAYYYKPRVRGLRPVLMFLHGRGGNPLEDCRKWAKVGTQFGWVVCPQGPEDNGDGTRAWNNSVPAGKAVMDATLHALQAKYKGKVQLRGNVLIGFSEGAFIAMQVGLHDPVTWNRWLILAANDQYWWGDSEQVLHENRRRYKRVYLFTGENDEVAESTVRVGDAIKKEKIPVKVRIAPGVGHEIPGDRMVTNYRRPLLWLVSAK
jgi:predicted esterase